MARAALATVDPAHAVNLTLYHDDGPGVLEDRLMDIASRRRVRVLEKKGAAGDPRACTAA
eukprot:gene16312-3415_t